MKRWELARRIEIQPDAHYLVLFCQLRANEEPWFGVELGIEINRRLASVARGERPLVATPWMVRKITISDTILRRLKQGRL